MSSHSQVVAVVAYKGELLFIDSTNVENVNTTNFPERRSPMPISIKHRVMTIEFGDQEPVVKPYRGEVAIKSRGIGDTFPYLYVSDDKIELWNAERLKDHFLKTANIHCNGHRELVPSRSLSGVWLYTCKDGTTYRFDDTSGRFCRFFFDTVGKLGKHYEESEMPIQTLFAQQGEPTVLFKAGSRFFTVESCDEGVVNEIAPFNKLPEKYQPDSKGRPYTNLVDFSDGMILFTSGVDIDIQETLIILHKDMSTEEVVLPHELKSSGAGARFLKGSNKIFWRIQAYRSTDSAEWFYFYDLSTKQFTKLSLGKGSDKLGTQRAPSG